jgi:hypothetical protein
MTIQLVFEELLGKHKAKEVDEVVEEAKSSTYLFLEEYLEAPGSSRGNPDKHKDVKNRGEKLGVCYVSTFGKNKDKRFRFLVLNKSEWLKWKVLEELGLINHVHFFVIDPETLKNYIAIHQEKGDISKYHLTLQKIF